MKRRVILFHLLFWITLYVLWVLIFRSYSVSLTKTMTIEFCYLLFITADYYVVNDLIIPQLLRRRRYLSFIGGTLVIIMISALGRAWVAWQMNIHYFHTLNPLDFSSLLLNSIFNISFWVLLITLGTLLIDNMRAQQKLDLLEKERIKSELDFLKAQINPHALFNSLNTIYGHIDKDNQLARNVLLRFSDLLRYQLYDCADEKVNLMREIAFLKNYIEFQQLRNGGNAIIEVQADVKESKLEIAPLLLVVLVENAFKFVSNFLDKENKIKIDIKVEKGSLICFVSNTTEIGRSNMSIHTGGIGITNLKRRLELLYENRYKLTAHSYEDRYEATLMLELNG